MGEQTGLPVRAVKGGEFQIYGASIAPSKWKSFMMVEFFLKASSVDGVPEGALIRKAVCISLVSCNQGIYHFSGTIGYSGGDRTSRSASLKGTFDSSTEQGVLQVYWPETEGGKK